MIELYSLATAKNGMRFDNRYCWAVAFQNGLTARVRAYPRPGPGRPAVRGESDCIIRENFFVFTAFRSHCHNIAWT